MSKQKTKKRLDLLLVEKGIAPSEAKAQAIILTGNVLVNDIPVDKPGTAVSIEAEIRIRGAASRFVGRGGDKLQGALEHFKLQLQGVTALDVGASTGGFTDCLLQHGAARVYAVDVGYNQLDLSLRKDTRVVVLEKTHVRDLTVETFTPPPTVITVDVSFISARVVLDSVVAVLPNPAEIIVLVKPQFELPRERVAEGGLISSIEDQMEAVRLVENHAAKNLGLRSLGSVPSKLRGEKSGNQEYCLLLAKS